MPVIAAFNPKGGSAKSTTILVAAEAFARRGASVTIIDTDPQQSLANWRSHASDSPITVITETRAERIHGAIREATARSTLVFIDMAGFNSDVRTPVASKADLIIVPMQASGEDARRAANALAYLSADEETLGRPIDKRILWARTVPNMVTRVERKIMEEIRKNNIPEFRTHLHQREAYKAIMLELTPLHLLDREEFNGIDKAIANADMLAAELAEIIMKKQQGSETPAAVAV